VNASFRTRFLLLLFALTLATPGFAQTPTVGQANNERPICDQLQALLLIEQQLDEAKTFDKPVATISIMVRAADLLWPYHQERARAVFTGAYDLASQHFQRRGDEYSKEEGVRLQLPDQRFIVLKAIAKRDPAWARRLAERTAEESKREAERGAAEAKNPSSPSFIDKRSQEGGKILDLAISTLAVDEKTAISLASSTLGYPGPVELPRFLYKLAEVDQPAADSFCAEAIGVYLDAPLDGLFYLSVYPFGLNTIVVPAPVTMWYSPPQNFAPNEKLQRTYLEALFRRGDLSLKAPVRAQDDTGQLPSYQFPDAARVYVALSRLEALIAERQPALLERAVTLRSTLASMLPSSLRQEAEGSMREQQQFEENSFERNLEEAERESNPAERDGALALAILGAPDSESTDRLSDLVRKIGDDKLRRQMVNWLCFHRTQKAIKDGRLDEAKQLAEKVEQLDHRAYLSYEIAEESLRRLDDTVRAREALDGVAASAAKAPDTNEKARTLLGVAHLYSKFDHLRAFEVMADAVKTINKVAEPDFSRGVIFQRIEGPRFTQFRARQVSGFSLENSFRELGPHDFEGALSLAKTIQNKSLRSTAIVALAASCMESLERTRKTKEPPKPATKAPGPKPGTPRR